ncbi:hypothetical protein [Stenotrophomonas sp. PS02289]|uniref:hypothetical protein n=1 Tax=Stenotrophomonas sp. PS02289 TaxID=2991422 RepID=UPI00249CC9D4|nr:hypothetical protein [Stenotrophomonas sp. PS02289]
MKLIIKEYLSQLRESGDLDRLLPDLLSRMKIIPISRPQIGVRQNGVDIAAVGKDDQGMKRLYLFVLKVGDLGRKDWNGGVNGVRETLGQIEDVYLPTSVRPQHRSLPVTVVICSTGDLRQDVVQDFTGYGNGKASHYSLVYWSGDDLAGWIEEHLLDEYAIEPSARADLRRALALIGSRDYDLRHAHKVLRSLLLDGEHGSRASTAAGQKRFIRQLKTTNLVLEIAFRWAAEGGNLLNAFRLGERCCLWAWEAIRLRGLTGYGPAKRVFQDLYQSHLRICDAYIEKMRTYFAVRDGVSIFSGENALVTNTIYEQIGILAEIGILHLERSTRPGLSAQGREDALARAQSVSTLLVQLIFNNPSSFSPRYDGNAIEISLALILLHNTQAHQSASRWLEHLAGRLRFTFAVSHCFPIATDSMEDLVAMEVLDLSEEQIQRLRHLSTLIPTIMYWCAKFGLKDLYQRLQAQQDVGFKGVFFQLWYADSKTESLLYREPAQHDSGAMEISIHLPTQMSELNELERLKRQSGNIATVDSFSAVSAGAPALVLMACRHFRTPVPPQVWFT